MAACVAEHEFEEIGISPYEMSTSVKVLLGFDLIVGARNELFNDSTVASSCEVCRWRVIDH